MVLCYTSVPDNGFRLDGALRRFDNRLFHAHASCHLRFCFHHYSTPFPPAQAQSAGTSANCVILSSPIADASSRITISQQVNGPRRVEWEAQTHAQVHADVDGGTRSRAETDGSGSERTGDGGWTMDDGIVRSGHSRHRNEWESTEHGE